METVGQTIRRLRMERGMTQAELAAAARVGHSHLSRIENDLHEPNIRWLRDVAAALDVSVDQLKGGR